MKQNEKPFDIFLSYKSQDHKWVNNFKDNLRVRGLKVWLDKDEIRPGDLFAQALENGIDTSRSVGLIVTPESIKSPWVKAEYYRALSLAKANKLQLIPIILSHVNKMPGFLEGLQYVDFSDPDPKSFDRSLDRLIWPGITNKQITTILMNLDSSPIWDSLTDMLKEERIDIHYTASDLDRAKLYIDDVLKNPNDKRLVVILDLSPGDSISSPFLWKQHQLIEHYRNQAREYPHLKVAFILFVDPKMWKQVSDIKDFDPSVLEEYRFKFYKLAKDATNINTLRDSFREIYNKAQLDLMRTAFLKVKSPK